MPLDITPIPVRICRCQRCRQETGIDPVSKATFAGQYVGEAEYKAHQRKDRSSVQGASHYGSLQIKPGAIKLPETAPDPSLVQPSAQLLSHAPNPLQKKIFDIRIRLLRDRGIISGGNLVFREPANRESPGMLNPEEEALKLQDNVPANKVAIIHERWLLSAAAVLEEIEASADDAEIRRFSHNLIIDVKQELSEVLSSKMLEWERQRRHLLQLPSQVRVIHNGMAPQTYTDRR
jgi:hypothetical protein